jgi:hypothetical protein
MKLSMQFCFFAASSDPYVNLNDPTQGPSLNVTLNQRLSAPLLTGTLFSTA